MNPEVTNNNKLEIGGVLGEGQILNTMADDEDEPINKVSGTHKV